MLKHYVTFYPNTDKLKTFRQTWKGKDDRYEEYYENGKVSLYKEWDSDNIYWLKREYNENGKITYYENSKGYWRKSEYDNNDEEIYYEESTGFIIDDSLNNNIC